jgi:YfiH family protein
MLRISAIERLGARVAAMSGMEDGDCATAAVSNRTAFLRRLGLDPARVGAVRQVHGTEVAVLPPLPGTETEADALVVAAPSWGALVSVADCVPIWLVDPGRGRGAVVHAGRAGTFLGVAAAAARHFPEPAAVHAWIGPSVGPCCYEVSEVLAAQADTCGVPRRGRYLDLWAANAAQLRAVGVPASQIGGSAHCTVCGGGFHSYRAHATACRNVAVLSL